MRKTGRRARDGGSGLEGLGLPPRSGSLRALLKSDFLAHGAQAIEVVRRKSLVMRLSRVEKILLGVAGSVIFGMAAALWQIAAVAAQIAGR